MGLSLSTTIFLFFVCLCGGIAIGMIFSRFKNRPSEIPPDKVEKKAGKEDMHPVQISLVEREATGVLHACIDNSGNTWLEMDGQRLDNKHSMPDGQMKRLVKLVLEMRSWLDDSEISEIPPTTLPGRQSRGSSLTAIFRKPKVAALLTGKAQIQPGHGSIVDQIEAILQRKLIGTVFGGRNIHLREGQGGEVLVQIGQERFLGVDAVTDAGIKDLIRKAVVEWENGLK